MLKDETFAILVSNQAALSRPLINDQTRYWHIGIWVEDSPYPGFLCALNEEYNPEGVNGTQEYCVVCRRLLDEALARGLEQIAELERSVR